MGVFNTQKDGYTWININAIPRFKKGEKKPFQVFTTFKDITERKKAEDEINSKNQFIEDIVNTIPSHLYIYDLKKNKNVYSNIFLMDMLGYSPEEFQEMASTALPSLIHPADKNRLSDMIQRLIVSQDNQVQEAEYRFRHKNGSWIWVADRAIPFERTSDGQVLQILGASVNITERKQAEEGMNQYKHIVANSTDMLALLDKQYYYLAANKAYLDGFKLTHEKLIGNKMIQVFGEDYLNTVIKPNADRCMSGEEVNYQTWKDFPGYGRRYMDINFYPYYDENNKIVGFAVNGRNITKQKHAEDELKKKMHHLEIFNKAAVGRELRMIELKKEINELLQKAGEPNKYL